MFDLIEGLKARLIVNDCYDEDTKEILDKLVHKLELAEKIESCLYDPDLFLVYKHTDPNGKIYIGITQNHPQTRWNEGGGYEKQHKFYKAIQKYGWINFKHEIVAAGLTKEEALELENDLILQYQSYDISFGYNTRVEMSTKSQSKSNNVKIKLVVDTFAISQELVTQYSFKTKDGILYYKRDGVYVLEEEKPFLQRALITDYRVPVKQHQEIINQIKIISAISIDDLSQEEREFFYPQNNTELTQWIRFNNIDDLILTSTPTDVLFKNYLSWCENNKIKTRLGKKHFFAQIENKFDLIKKQKADGKRYFIKIK